MRIAITLIWTALVCPPVVADDGEEAHPKAPSRIGAKSLAKEDDAPEEEMSEDDKKLALARKAAVISETKRSIEDKTKERIDTQRRRDLLRVRELNAQITDLKKKLASQNRRALAEYLDEARQVLADARRDEAKDLEKKEREKEVAELIKKAGPLAIVRFGIVTNTINLPELVLVIRNTTNQAIEAFEVEAECFDKFGDEVSFTGRDNRFRGISQKTLGAGREERCEWQMSLHQTTAVAHVWISRIKMADGTEIRQTKEEAKGHGPAALVEAKRVE